MIKTLRPYQQEALNNLRLRLKETEHPLLVNASVGAGKSLIIAELLLIIERAGWRALCLTMNSTLIRQNAETYNLQGGNSGIYCAALSKKDIDYPIIFASPMSVIRSIKEEKNFSKIPFNLIIVDECHNINYSEKNTIYMKIFNWYAALSKEKGHKLRFVGLTGTPYRGKGISIIGQNNFFKEEVCDISAEWLIKEGYLTNPVWGYCEKTLQYDFQKLKINVMGKFNSSELKEEVNKKPRLTAKIMAEVQEIVKKRNGAFIFATSIEHCKECAEWLPEDETAIIIGDTPDSLREEYIIKARKGIVKYLVNVNVLCTGVDVPSFDTVVFVRPTESLVLYMQCLGRGLRLHEGKKECLILDYAGNLERHGDIDNPIINKALSQVRQENDADYCIACYECETFNKVTARRCIGTKHDKRCDHRFEWKDCAGCGAANDIVAKFCRICKIELLDPNRALNDTAANKNTFTIDVESTKYDLFIINGFPRFDITYTLNKKNNPTKFKIASENILIKSDKAIRFFYHTIIKEHFMHPHQSFNKLQNIDYLKSIIENKELYFPYAIDCIDTGQGRLKVIKKYFNHVIADKDEKECRVIFTFIEFEKNRIIFKYLIRENDRCKLYEDIYKLNSPLSLKRFIKNFGSQLGGNIETIKEYELKIRFPETVFIDLTGKVKAHGENKKDWRDNQNLITSRVALSNAWEKWCEIIKFELIMESKGLLTNGKKSKMFIVNLYGFYTYSYYNQEYEAIAYFSCYLSEDDYSNLINGTYIFFMPEANGRHGVDVEQWKNFERTFKKVLIYRD